jgi:hypothetical protein
LEIALAIPSEALRVIATRRESILAALVTEDFVLRFSSSLRMLLLVVIAVLGLVTSVFAGIDPGVVPEPTSVLIWLGLIGVVSAVTGRRGRRG